MCIVLQDARLGIRGACQHLAWKHAWQRLPCRASVSRRRHYVGKLSGMPFYPTDGVSLDTTFSLAHATQMPVCDNATHVERLLELGFHQVAIRNGLLYQYIFNSSPRGTPYSLLQWKGKVHCSIGNKAEPILRSRLGILIPKSRRDGRYFHHQHLINRLTGTKDQCYRQTLVPH